MLSSAPNCVCLDIDIHKLLVELKRTGENRLLKWVCSILWVVCAVGIGQSSYSKWPTLIPALSLKCQYSKGPHAVNSLPPSQCSFLHTWDIRCNSQILKQALLYPFPPKEWLFSFFFFFFGSFSRIEEISFKSLIRGTCSHLLATNPTSAWLSSFEKALLLSPWSACTGNP